MTYVGTHAASPTVKNLMWMVNDNSSSDTGTTDNFATRYVVCRIDVVVPTIRRLQR